jgi:hypothetical protein
MDNAVRMVEKGFGVQLSKNNLNKDNIYQAISEVINNKRLALM